MRKIQGPTIFATEITKKDIGSGLIAPDTASTQKMMYQVEMVSDEVTRDIMVGDTIYVAPKVAASRHSLIVDGVEYTVFDESNIIMVERV